MKTVKQVINENKEFKSLINAVINQLGDTESIEDINRHGINAGFNGFIYYADTHAFTKKNRKQITQLLNCTAAILGEDPFNMVLSFRCLNNDSETRKELHQFLGGGRLNEQNSVTNALAWFAAEEVCRMFEND